MTGSPGPEPGPARPRAWLLTRVTGLFLAVLLPLHAAVVLVHDDIGRTTQATVTARLAGRWWPGLEWATLTLALVHGVLVARARLVAVLPPGRRRGAATGATVAAATVLGLGVTRTMLLFS